MSNRIYSIITGKDNFLAKVVNEETAIKLDSQLEPKYVSALTENLLILEDVVTLVPNGNNGVGILPFEDLAFGSNYISIPASSITSIYLVSDKLATQVRAAVAGIEISK